MCDQNLTHSLDTLKSLSINIVAQVVIRDACGTWHSLCTVTSIYGIQKSTRNRHKLGNKLVSGWQKIQGSKQREIELITKKFWRKRREKIFRSRSWLLLLLKKICNQKMYIFIPTFCWRWSWWSGYVPTDLPSTGKLVSTNQRPNESYSIRSFTRSI